MRQMVRSPAAKRVIRPALSCLVVLNLWLVDAHAQVPSPTPVTTAAPSTAAAAPSKLDATGEARLADIAHELRCLVCQNQSIADSNAGLAVDLRNQIRTQISAGKTDQEIRDFMVARYGDFVLYRPPLKASTALLWVGPFVLLVIGMGVWWRLTRRRSAAAQAPNGDAAKPANAELDRLLGQ